MDKQVQVKHIQWKVMIMLSMSKKLLMENSIQ